MDASASTGRPADHFEFPCSLAQQRLWIDDRLSPGRASYNIHAAIRLASALDPGVLECALAALIDRHETLRTTFHERGGTPLQCVASEGHCAFTVDDLRSCPVADRTAQLMALARREAQAPFDLTQGPLLRVRLVRLDAASSVLMVTVHHIVADAWSMGVLLHDLTALYEDIAQGRTPNLPELPIQYADFAVWQRERADDGGPDGELAWWREQLRDLPTLDLPTDHVRPPIASHRGRTTHFGLDDALSSAVQDLAKAHAVTPYVVLLAALGVVLQVNSGQDEIVVGAPVAGRDRPELERLIGFFVNMIVLRLDMSGQPDVAALLQRVQRTLHDGLGHAALPFEQVVQALKPPRDLSRNPLFQVSVQYLASPSMVARTSPGRGDGDGEGNGSASVMQVQRGAANFDLSFDFWQRDGRMEGRVDFALDLFEAATIERWIAQWRQVLTQMCAGRGITASEFDLLSPEEHRQVEQAWAGLPLSDPPAQHMASRWADIVQAQPGAIAVIDETGPCSFAELDLMARRIAALLSQRGVLHGDAVGVALPRGTTQIASLLAIVQLGAAYVALDAAWPVDRLRTCATLAGLKHALCLPPDADMLAAAGLDACRLDTLPQEPLPVSALPDVEVEAPVYVAFTSGSTGVPKGVVVPQRGVLRLVRDNPQVPMYQTDRVLVHSPLAFDASTLEIWGGLLQGATLVIPPARALGLDDIAACLDAQRITVAWFTAGLFHQLAASHAPSLARLQRLYAGGDVLSAEAVRKVLALGEGRLTVLNGYGPTENTTFTCVHAMRDAGDVPSQVPIGRPIAGTHVRVMDRWGRPAPVGVAGELYAGGQGVALRYLGDHALTRHAFVADPLGATADPFYRTGDRVCWQADGTLRFLGRIDRQLKVRGFRIEPAEVEAALRALPGVNDAHVLARADHSGDKHLAACLAVADGTQLATLKQLLAERLPAWMLPGEWHLLPALTLNANGKIDAAMLDALDAGRADAGSADSERQAGEALEGDIEILIAELWSEVLGRAVDDPHTGFFADLGGHSLLATQVVSRLNAGLQIQLPLAAMFEQPTIRGLSARVESLLLADLEAQPA